MAMTNIIVRQETLADEAAINVVNISAFEGEAEARLVAALRQSRHYIPELSLVADIDGRLVGHIMLSRAHLQSSDGEVEVLALAPMAVVPSQSHRGIGSTLVRAAITQAANLGARAIVVVGHPPFYARFDFERASKWKIRCSLAVPEEAVQALELIKGSLSCGGVINYSPIFSGISQQSSSDFLNRSPE